MQDAFSRGYRRNLAGLIVPEELSREREVWLYDDWRTLERATKLLTLRKLKFQFGCTEPGCDAPIERMRNPDGGLTLRCAHKDRVVMRRV